MVILPLLALVGTALAIRIADASAGRSRAVVRAFVIIGVWLVLTTEVLSLLGLLNQAGLVLAWGLPVVGLALWIAFHRAELGRIRFDLSQLAATRGERSLAVCVGAIFAITALVAFLAPPQTWDSLNYHMARVAHWAQMGAVRMYATGIEVQNSRTPLAEFGMLHAYVLAGGDRWVNFVEWLAMVGSVVGVAGIANRLKFPRPAALLAMIYAATIPMGIIQASSTMTDYVGALWVVALAVEVLALRDDASPGAPIVFGGAAAGLAFLTKPTTVPYLVSLGVLAAWVLWRRRPTRFPWKAFAVGGAAFVVLNAGHWTRSTLLYGDPITGGDQLTVSAHANDIKDPRALVSNVIRNVGLHLGTPSPHVNKALTLGALALHQMLGIAPNDPRTTAIGVFEVEEPTTNEIKAGNPLHLLVGAVAGLWMLRRRREFDRLAVAYLLACVAGFLIFCWIFKWQIFGSRLHLPFFLLLAPAAGGVIARSLSLRASLAVGWAFVLAAIPWLIGIGSRPLIPLPGEATSGSVLTEERTPLIFANGEYLVQPYTSMTGAALSEGCSEIGISLSGGAAEYPLWVLLGAPRRGLRIEWLVSGTPSARYTPTDFRPCAVICEGCEGMDAFAGLPEAYSVGGYRLYLQPQEAE